MRAFFALAGEASPASLKTSLPMPTSLADRSSGAPLVRTPSVPAQARARRMAVLGAMLALGLGGGLVAYLVTPASSPPTPDAQTGPFSYFPTQ